MIVCMVVARFSFEGHEPQAEHVERGHERGQYAHYVKQIEYGVLRSGLPHRGQDLVLGPEPGKRRDTGDGYATYQHHQGGYLQLLRQPSHEAHVLSVHGVDDRTGAQEEQGLEERVVHQVEHAGGVPGVSLLGQGKEVPARPQGQEHVSQLADGRVGQNPLDVGVVQRHGRCHQGSNASNDGNYEHRVRRLHHHGVGTGHEVHTGLDHGGCMDKGRDRGRALHGIRKPVVQGELGGLTDRTTKDEEGAEGQHAVPADEVLEVIVEDVLVVQVPAEADEEDEQAEHEHYVADPGDQEGLLGRGGRGGLGVPEPDEQVGTQADQLPEDEHLQVVGRQDQAQHDADEQGYDRVVPALLLSLLVHVAYGVNDDQGGYE